jgi:hypothetical protein
VPLTDSTDSEIVLQAPVTVAVNSAGQFTVALYATDDTALAPAGWTWQITENIAGLTPSTWSFFLAYGSGSTQDLSDLTPVAEVTPVSAYLPESGGLMTGTITLGGSPPLKLPSGTSGDVLTSDASGNLTLAGIPGASLVSPAFTGTPTAPTASPLTDDTQIATTAYADNAVSTEKSRAEAAEALLAPLASPALTGSPTAPTQTTGDSSTKIATDAFVQAALPSGSSPLPIGSGGTGQTTAQLALNALAGATTSGDYLRGTGSNVQMHALEAADLAGTVAIANGGTGSGTQNFVDLTSGQSIAGVKTFTGEVVVPTPVNTTDAVTKAYADAIASGLSARASVNEATTAVLSPSYNWTSTGGGTLTATTTGVLTVDGQSVALNDRVLVQNETGGNAPYNGIYLCTTAGASGGSPAAYVLTRSTDMNTGADFPGAVTFCEKGTTNTGSGFVCITPPTVTLNTTNITWTQNSATGAITAGSGLTQSGSTISLTAPVPINLGGTGTETGAPANEVFAGPNGSTGAPAFRALVSADIPNNAANTSGTAAGLSSTLAIGSGGTGAGTASGARTNLGLGAAALLATPIPAADLPGPSAWINAVTQYSASTGGSGSANATAIQNAINAAATAGGGEVYLPAGTYPITNLTLSTAVTLLGDGPGATVLSVAAGTTGAVIALTTPASTRRTCVRDLMVEGNNVSVTGISLVNTGLSPGTPGQHRLYNVVVQDCGVDAFYYGTALVETFTAFCTAYNAGRYGYNITTGATDSRWVSCTTGPSASHGFVVTGSNNHFSLCKAYYAGYNGSTFSAGHGWYVVGTSAYPTMGNTWDGCEAQDCAQQGWNFTPNGGSLNNLTMTACVIDSCNAASGTGGNGVAIATNSVVYSSVTNCVAWNRSGGAGAMTYGISVAGTQTGLVISGNGFNIPVTGSTGPFFYSSGYGYLLAEPYIFDLTGVSEYVKTPALVQAPASAQALSNSTAITVNTAYGLIPLTASAAVTGITMPTSGLQSGQTVTLVNQSAYSITFAASGTSNVADGTSDVIAAATSAVYSWDGNTSLWYRVAGTLPPATTVAEGVVQLAGDLGGTASSPVVEKIQGTAISAPAGGATHFLTATGAWNIPSGASTVVTVATATGTAATDEANIASAVTAAGSGGTVYFPQGTYSAANISPLSGQTWYGPAVIQRPPGASSVITATGITGWTMTGGLTVDGGGAPFAYTAAGTPTTTFTAPGSAYLNGTQVVLTVSPTGTGSPPSGISNGTTYYVVSASADTFKLSTTLGGSATGSGSGSGLVSGNLSTYQPAVSLTNCTGCRLDGITVQNTPAADEAAGNPAIQLRGTVRCTVINCQITNVGYGILLGLVSGDQNSPTFYTCYANVISDCMIDNSVNDAIFMTENLGTVTPGTVYGLVAGNVVTGCTIRNCGDSAVEIGSGSVYCEVSGCTMIGISNASGNNGIFFRDASHCNATGCTVSNYTKSGSTGVQMLNLNSTNTHNSVNSIDVYNCFYGYQVCGSYDGTTLNTNGTPAVDIAINGGVVEGTLGSGIWLFNVNGFSITGTQVYAAGQQGIQIGEYLTTGTGCTDGTITGCRVLNSSQDASGNVGIILFENTAGITISGCRVGDNQGGSATQKYGIDIYDTSVTNVTIEGCDLRGYATGGAPISNSSTAPPIRVFRCLGYNPQGLLLVTPSASPWTYTAGATPEVLYLAGATVSGVTKNTIAIPYNSAASTSTAYALEPNESVTISYTGSFSYSATDRK